MISMTLPNAGQCFYVPSPLSICQVVVPYSYNQLINAS